jgi:hypothetical protein
MLEEFQTVCYELHYFNFFIDSYSLKVPQTDLFEKWTSLQQAKKFAGITKAEFSLQS